MTKPEVHEGMPHHQHFPPAKRREDRNPEQYHKEQKKNVARILTAHPPKITMAKLLPARMIYYKPCIL
jgi:hypothetical protein